MQIKTIAVLLISFLFMGILPFVNAAEVSSGAVTKLTGTSIDLLVGTPEGIDEPLDERRSRPEPVYDHDFSEFLNYDITSEENSEPDLSWCESEENEITLEENHEEINDLLTEIEDLEAQENENFQSDFDDNISDCVETELKL